MGKMVRCYAWGNEEGWEARCLDLDLSVTGRSIEEVRMLLNDAIRTYQNDVGKEAAADQYRLMNRRVPLLSRLWFHLWFATGKALNSGSDGATNRQAFHCPA